MANRVLRDWTKSDKVNNLSFNAEILFVRLIMNADDFGCFYAEPKLLKSFCFPLKNIRETDITLWLQELVSNGLIALYDAESKQYLEIINFGQRLRQTKRKFPENKHLKENDSELRTIDSDPPLETETETETETEGENDFIVFEGLKFLKSHIIHSEKFVKDKISVETFMQQNKIAEIKQLKSYLIEFLKHLNVEGKAYEKESFKDFKRHFLNWFRKVSRNETQAIKSNKNGVSADWLA